MEPTTAQVPTSPYADVLASGTSNRAMLRTERELTNVDSGGDRSSNFSRNALWEAELRGGRQGGTSFAMILGPSGSLTRVETSLNLRHCARWTVLISPFI
ncbi:unnamed protein product [Peniophora sp. CBMAI 1063]|nr:unnamed protein product [Peniophora sp. CBMAI 1063]